MLEKNLFVVVAPSADNKAFEGKCACDRRGIKSHTFVSDCDCARVDAGLRFRSKGVCFVNVHSEKFP